MADINMIARQINMYLMKEMLTTIDNQMDAVGRRSRDGIMGNKYAPLLYLTIKVSSFLMITYLQKYNSQFSPI